MLWQNVGAIINRPLNPTQLSKYGTIVDGAIQNIPKFYTNVSVDKYVIMPNHVHMIVLIENETKTTNGRLIIDPTLSRIVQQLKSYVTKDIGSSIWQKSFYDHVIRDTKDYEGIWKYIDENPLKWSEDNYYNL